MSVTLRGNVIIVGLAINMLIPALSAFVLQYMNAASINLQWLNISKLKLEIPIIRNFPLIGSILSGHPPLTYAAFISVFLMGLLMYKTRFGVHIRVTGENEDAALSLGLKTNCYKYAGILIGSMMCALAGINLSFERLGIYTNNMTAGRGFIAIAAIYCGRGNPKTCAVYAMVFGIARAVSVHLGLLAGPAAALVDIIPYVIIAATLTAVSAVKRRNQTSRGF
jgi:simple sugar transport system permease protein